MEISVVRRSVVISLVASFLFVSSSQAADQSSSDRHVRSLEPCRSTLVEEAAQQSPTVRALVDTLEQSDLIVYIRCVFFKDSALSGRLGFLGTVAHLRYVVIEVRFYEQASTRIATLGHELQHAVEIAEAPSIRDQRTMAEHYRRIGVAVGRHPLIFETAAAKAVADRVHREVFATSTRSRAADIAAGSR
jgi:hypothetical protein